MWTIETIKRETSKLVHTLRHVGLEHDNSDVIDTKRVETTEEGCIITSVLYNIEFDFRHLTVVITTLNGTNEKYHVSILTKACRDIVKRIDEMLTNYKEYFEETEEIDEPTETTHTPTLDFEYRNLMYTDKYKAAHNTPSTQEDERDRAKYLMETHSFPSTAYKRHSYKEVDKVCGDCSHFNACMQGYQTVAPTCCMFDSLYRARKNPNWHNVSLATLANIDFDMLDEKRQTYLTIYRELQQTLSYLRKCKTESSYYACLNRYLKKRDLYANKISANMFRYTSTKLSMQNVESGVWASECEEATGYHESRRYNKSRVGK